MSRFRTSLWILCAVAATPCFASDTAGIEFFEKQVRPLLVTRCAECHGEKLQHGGLRLDRKSTFFKGGDGGPILDSQNPTASRFLQAIAHSEELAMPPDEKLPDTEIAALTQWVEMGAPWPDDPEEHGNDPAALAKEHWSFQSIGAPQAPATRHPAWIRSPVDAFVLAKMELEGLLPNPAADRRTLLRRVTYDLTGLPPTWEETEAFINDPAPDAFAKVVDRLLASPHYGERWGRHWLDIARYSDTKGYVFTEDRRYHFAFTYRDYVIDSLNADKSYQQFLMEQIAADLMPTEESKESLAALGFLTLGRRFLNDRHEIIDDRIDVVTRGLMGLTVTCARCHDHKYDPIPTADYYSLYGVFASTQEPGDLPVLGPARDDAEAAAYEQRVKETNEAIKTYLSERQLELANTIRSSLAKYVKAAGALGGDPKNEKLEEHAKSSGLNPNLLRSCMNRWDAIHRFVGENGLPWMANGWIAPDRAFLESFAQALDQLASVPESEVESLLGDAAKKRLGEMRGQLDGMQRSHPGAPRRAMALQDAPTPVEPVVFVRGNPGRPGDKVPRQFLGVLSGESRQPFAQGSGRLELARAIASPENPLTARVAVNWVWQHLFGQGLVRTPSDFGLRGEPPTHPELMDYLARSFIESGWSLKALHRQILLSSTYQQASTSHADYAERDPANTLLWKQNRRRLDFESTRDSILAVTGRLDPKIGGRSVSITDKPYALRRTLYAFVDRQNLESLFRTFDFANPNTSAPSRFVTTIPQQSLYFMNSPFVTEQTNHLVDDAALKDLAHDDERVQHLYRRLFSREASPDEVSLGLAFVVNQQSAPAGRTASAWSYGYGRYDEAAGQLVGFEPFPHFTGNAWQMDRRFPHPKLGHLILHADSGHPGRDTDHSVVRRWTATDDRTVAIRGTLAHPKGEGDGVRAYVSSSRRGALASWTAHNSELATEIESFDVKAGETLDFIISCGGSDSHDSFHWGPVVETVKDGQVQGQVWDARADFAGPAPPPLTPWQKYAQALVMTNEFCIID